MSEWNYSWKKFEIAIRHFGNENVDSLYAKMRIQNNFSMQPKRPIFTHLLFLLESGWGLIKLIQLSNDFKMAIREYLVGYKDWKLLKFCCTSLLEYCSRFYEQYCPQNYIRKYMFTIKLKIFFTHVFSIILKKFLFPPIWLMLDLNLGTF